MRWLIRGLLLVGMIVPVPAVDAASTRAEREPVFLVAAPDRGFSGNQWVRAAFARFAPGRTSELVFVTDARGEPVLHAALDRLAAAGAREVVVLPVFLSSAEARYRLLRAQLQSWPNRQQRALHFAPPFGRHYLAVEALGARLRAAGPALRDAPCLIVGSGASGDAAAELSADLERIVAFARLDAPGPACAVHVWLEAADETGRERAARDLQQAVHATGASAVWPLHLGRHLDAMMRLDASLRAALPAEITLLEGDALAPELLYDWLAQTANARSPLPPEAVGVLLHAHGADWHWNEQVRAALAPLAAQVPVDYAFSMGDPETIAAAVERLRARGVRAVVLVRAFALRDSFAAGIERQLGMDVFASAPRQAPSAAHGSVHGSMHAHGSGGVMSPPARIVTDIPMISVGGVEDDPLFARALLAHAMDTATRPGDATVILVGHGSGDDRTDARWRDLLGSLAVQMRALGAPFRDIEVDTWREDWPDQREAAVARIRARVEAALGAHGEAVVVPARVNGIGPEQRLLAGLEFRLGEGFASHPLFARWVEAQVELGRGRLRAAYAAPADDLPAPAGRPKVAE